MSETISLGQIRPYQSGVNVNVIVLEAGPPRQTNNGTVSKMRVADMTGSIEMTRFTPEGEEFFAFEPGDILRIRGAFGSVYQGRLGVTVNWHAECKKSGEFTMTFSETPRITDLPLPPGTVDPRIRRHL